MTSTRIQVSPLHDGKSCPSIDVQWDDLGGLQSVSVSDCQGYAMRVDLFRHKGEIRAGMAKDGAFLGLWVGVESRGYIELAEYAGDVRCGFYARRGMNRYDILGEYLSDGKFVDRTSELRAASPEDSTSGLLETSVAKYPCAAGLRLSIDGIPVSWNQGNLSWALDWVDSELSVVRITGHETSVEVTPSSAHQGHLRIVGPDWAEGIVIYPSLKTIEEA